MFAHADTAHACRIDAEVWQTWNWKNTESLRSAAGTSAAPSTSARMEGCMKSCWNTAFM